MNKFLFLFFLLAPVAFAELELPANLLKLQDQNKAIAEQTLANITLGVAFLAGIVTFLSPCILPVLTLFVASSLQERKNKKKRFFFFMLGMSTALLLMGLVVGYLGKLSLDFFPYKALIAHFAGIFFIILGIGIFTGLTLGTFSLMQKPHGAYSAGFLFAFGWTACTGPVLAGVLAMAALLKNVWHAGLLLFIYTLGIGFPFLLLTFFGWSWKGKEYMLFGHTLHSSKMISGTLYFSTGLLLLILGDTAVINQVNFGLTGYYYLVQDKLLAGNGVLSYVGLLFLFGFAGIIYFLFRRKRT